MKKKFNLLSKETIQKQLYKYFGNKLEFDYLYNTDEKNISKTFFFSIFVAFIPIPMQMLIIAFLSIKFRFNIIIGVSLAWITNPLSMPFIYYLEYKVGNLFFNNDIDFQFETSWILNNLENIFLQLYVGAFIFSIVFSILAFFLSKLFFYIKKKM
jgi:hypothetical protein